MKRLCLRIIIPTALAIVCLPAAAHERIGRNTEPSLEKRAVRRGLEQPVVQNPHDQTALRAAFGCVEFAGRVEGIVVEVLVRSHYWFPGPMLEARPPGGELDNPAPGDYSRTNNQEDDVDELDIVKTDGSYIYATHDQSFSILRSWPAETAALESSTDLAAHPHGLFLLDNLAAVLSTAYVPFEEMMPIRSSQTARLQIFDVTDRAQPVEIRALEIDGYLVDARLIFGHLYLVVSSQVPVPGEAFELLSRQDIELPEVDWDAPYDEIMAAMEEARKILAPYVSEVVADLGLDTFLPHVTEHAAGMGPDRYWPLLGCTDVYFPNEPTGLNILSVVHFDLGAENIHSSELSANGIVADSWTVYANAETLVVSRSNWWSWDWMWMPNSQSMMTEIHRFSIDPEGPPFVEYSASGEVEGWLLNQFSMGEYEGYLRVATSDFQWWWEPDPDQEPASRLTVLWDNGLGQLAHVGSLDGIAPGEQIYAARFMGPKGFLVTFEQIDPLFTLDLADPANPKILGELKIPGFSAYLHPIGDDHLLGVGLDATEEGVPTGLAVSMFDVSDMSEPKLTDKYTITHGSQGWSWSEALSDHHAFTYHRGTLAMPAWIWDKEESFQGLLVFDADPIEGIDLRGHVDHMDLGSGPAFWFGSPWMRRSIVIEDALFSLSNRGVKASRLFDPDVTLATVPFPENLPLLDAQETDEKTELSAFRD